MKFTVLGSGTSTGVPNVGCDCDVCTSSDVRDSRLRTSLLIESDHTTVLIDTSSDFRQQMLRHRVMKIDGVVFTHHHFDHIGGFDDIRPYNFNVGAPMPIHAMQETLDVLEYTFPYAFGKVPSSGTSVPSVDVRIIDRDPFTIGDITLQPIPLYHGSSLRVNGYRMNNVAYCTDTNLIPVPSMELLKGLDVLILDGLRWEPHPTHFTIGDALRVVEQLQPKTTYLTHIAHQIKHADTEAQLPNNVFLAYDGLVVSG
ncbi:MAG: MBL fold metallo-hydrolase [Ignavibacteriae bacterium]|nr:MAG: MBL fold metallo-hydrolase [Ignavibacteriota bacterium]